MMEQSLDAVLVSSAPNITYLTGFSGFSKHEREAFLFIAAQPQASTHETLGYVLTDGRYTEAVKNNVKDFQLVQISAKLPFDKALKKLAKKHKIRKLGIENDNLTVKEHKAISKHFNNIYHYSVESMRIIKDQKEIAAIEKACRLSDKAFDYILNKIKKGVTEKQLTFEIEFFIKKNGADISFPPIVAYGKNSAFPHHQSSDKPLAISDKLVLLDFGVKLNNYCSDMTRTVFLGVANSEYKKMYRTVIEAQKIAIDRLVDKVTPSRRSNLAKKILAKHVDKIAREHIISQGYPTIPHSLGHGVGLEVHEAPRLSPKSKDILKPGMVFTIEPGIYIPGFGGVRIEDIVVLENSVPRLLTESPKETIQI